MRSGLTLSKTQIEVLSEIMFGDKALIFKNLPRQSGKSTLAAFLSNMPGVIVVVETERQKKYLINIGAKESMVFSRTEYKELGYNGRVLEDKINMIVFDEVQHIGVGALELVGAKKMPNTYKVLVLGTYHPNML